MYRDTTNVEPECMIIPEIIGATGIVTRSVRKHLEAVPGRHSMDSLQKTATLGTSHIIRKVLLEAWAVGITVGTTEVPGREGLWQETSISYNNNSRILEAPYKKPQYHNLTPVTTVPEEHDSNFSSCRKCKTGLWPGGSTWPQATKFVVQCEARKLICRLKTIYCLVWAATKNNASPCGLHVPSVTQSWALSSPCGLFALRRVYTGPPGWSSRLNQPKWTL